MPTPTSFPHRFRTIPLGPQPSTPIQPSPLPTSQSPASFKFCSNFSPKPRRFTLLQTLCRHEKSQLLCNQANPHSLRKTPGVGYRLRPCLRSSPTSVFSVPSVVNPVLTPFPATHAKNAPVTPFPATHTKSPSCKSFPCHTSEKQGVSPPLISFQQQSSASRLRQFSFCAVACYRARRRGKLCQ